MSIKIVAENRKARHDYTVISTLEAGMVLSGSEVKSLRNGQCQLKDSYVAFIGEQAFLQNAHISVYQASSYNNHEPERLRKLLLHRSELDKLHSQIKEKGYACVPLKIYFSKGLAKIELALVKGKKHQDKREDIKKRDAGREIARVMKRG